MVSPASIEGSDVDIEIQAYVLPTFSSSSESKFKAMMAWRYINIATFWSSSLTTMSERWRRKYYTPCQRRRSHEMKKRDTTSPNSAINVATDGPANLTHVQSFFYHVMIGIVRGSWSYTSPMSPIYALYDLEQTQESSFRYSAKMALPQIWHRPTSNITNGHYYIYGAIALITLGLVKYVCQALNSPLRNVPGPLLARFTRLWELQAIRNQDNPTFNIALHEKYGKIIKAFTRYRCQSHTQATD